MTTQTTPTLHRPDPGRLGRLSGASPDRRVLVPVTLLLAALVTGGVAQAVTPFIRQDDWTFLLPENTPGVVPPSYYNISEGRWLNTGWWWLVGQHGTPTTAALTYALGYAVLVAGVWRLVRLAGVRPPPLVDALLGVALYASAVWVQLLYWPGALTPSVLVGATAVWLLPWCARSPRRLAAWLLLGGVASVLAYPPLGVLLLVLAVFHLGAARWRTVLAVVGGWMASFGAGVLVTYTLNLLVNQHFGLRLAAWRHANSPTSLEALQVNVGRWLDTVGALWSGLWWVGGVGVAAVVLGWRDASVRPRLQRLLVSFTVAVGVDAAQTVGTGVVTEGRGQLWVWLLAVLPVALLLPASGAGARAAADRSGDASTPAARRNVGAVAVALLAVLAVGGVLAWRADVGEHQATRMAFASVAERAAARPDGEPVPVVVLYQDPVVGDSRNGRLTLSTLTLAFRVEQGLVPRACTGDECTRLASQPPGSVVPLGSSSGARVVGVVVPTPPAWL